MHRPPHVLRRNGSVIRLVLSRRHGALLSWALGIVLGLHGGLAASSVSAASSPPKPALTATARQAAAFYKSGEYDRVLQLLQSVAPGQEPDREMIRYALLSQVKLGKPEEAFKLYLRLIPAGQPDDPALLRDVARSFILSRVRDSQEHVRIAAYTALAEIGDKDTLPLLEDGLLDSSALVRARSAEAIGRSGMAGHSSALKRTLRDEAPGVRIAAINALSDAKVSGITEQLTEIARIDEGPESIFALAGLYKLGRTDVLIDISNAATLPDPEVRMAAIGILGRYAGLAASPF